MVKVGRRGSQNGTLVVTGKQGHVAYPERADNPVRGLVALMGALMYEPLDNGTREFRPFQSRIHFDRHRQPGREPDPGAAPARASTSASTTTTPRGRCAR